MTHHEPTETEAEADASFERLLLCSARADQLPPGATGEAWAKFVSASAGVALVATAAPGLGGVLHTARRASLRWLAVGALGGSALTAAWMGSRTVATSSRIAPASLPAEPAASLAPPLRGSSAPQPSPQPSSRQITQGELSLVHPRAPALKPTAARSLATAKPRDTSEGDASSLAAEVAALDAVQRAFASHDFSRAVRLVDQYQREFPRGQLAPDADALAIEALEAQGNSAELRRRAERFLSRYPKDPHRARVATLLEL